MSDQSAGLEIIGQPFERVYLDRGTQLRDSMLFRNRLAGFLQSQYNDLWRIAAYLKQESGFIIGSHPREFADFFTNTPIESILSSITIIWRFLREKDRQSGPPHVRAAAWHAFVARAMSEENMGYRLDSQAGVHFLIDEEFERSRASVLKCLEASRYSGVRDAFESAHSYLDAQPADEKASVRSAFEALEILARLIDPSSKNLNKNMVLNKLKPVAKKNAIDEIEEKVIDSVFEGIAMMVDGLHHYRHGQGKPEPVKPSLSLAIYVLSSTAAAIRWLVEIDKSRQPTEV